MLASDFKKLIEVIPDNFELKYLPPKIKTSRIGDKFYLDFVSNDSVSVGSINITDPVGLKQQIESLVKDYKETKVTELIDLCK